MAAGDDFSAALAQSLAATPADGGALADTPAGTATGKSNAQEQTDPVARHSAPDPVSSALTLLEQALAGALAGVQAASAAAQATTGTAGGSTSSADGGTIGASGKSSTAGLDLLLTQNLAAAGKSGGSTPAAADESSAGAVSATTASTAAAGLTAATQLSSAAHLASQQVSAPSGMALGSPVGTSAWTDELGAKLTWMAHQGIQSASLQLSPEHLGPLQVSISVHDGQASVWFGAAQADTRTALQQSLPQLRELFAGQGLTLADAGVSREPPRGQGQQQSARATPSVSGVTAVSLDRADTRNSNAGGLGLLDTYA